MSINSKHGICEADQMKFIGCLPHRPKGATRVPVYSARPRKQRDRHKLNYEKARHIRESHRNGMSVSHLAKDYGVSRDSIYHILKQDSYPEMQP